mmetsp:Transcript_164057/g.521679  ORF Transcript_164057/g.521679 Transcript_164057/m.521679 type:complete len:124 (+) Transcript_164057:659-1030(+)
MFGKGTYFAEHSSKSDLYAKPDNDGIRRTLLTLVCLGEAFRTKSGMTEFNMPPCAKCSLEIRASCTCPSKGDTFDSISAVTKDEGGSVDLPEHVIFASYQAVPLVEVAYKHHAECVCNLCRRC